MQILDLPVDRRDLMGSANSRRLRRAGQIPCALYGAGEANVNLVTKAHDFEAVLHAHSALVKLKLGEIQQVALIREVKWDDITESLPAFLTMVTMPFAYSISAGIASGFVSYAAGKVLTGRARQCPLIVYVFAALFVAQYALAP